MNNLPEPVLTLGEAIVAGGASYYPVYLENIPSYSADTTVDTEVQGLQSWSFTVGDINDSDTNPVRAGIEIMLQNAGITENTEEILANIVGLVATAPSVSMPCIITLSLTGYESVSATVSAPSEEGGN